MISIEIPVVKKIMNVERRTKAKYVQCVPRKVFGSAEFDTKYTIYLSLCTPSTHPNTF